MVCSTSVVGATCSTNPDAPGVIVPPESCDLVLLGVDEDCDGFINEGFNYGLKKWGQGCDGIGQCGSGLVVCNSQGQVTCSTNPDGNMPKNTPEICNGDTVINFGGVFRRVSVRISGISGLFLTITDNETIAALINIVATLFLFL